jgi:hypothetical protein
VRTSTAGRWLLEAVQAAVEWSARRKTPHLSADVMYQPQKPSALVRRVAAVATITLAVAGQLSCDDASSCTEPECMQFCDSDAPRPECCAESCDNHVLADAVCLGGIWKCPGGSVPFSSCPGPRVCAGAECAEGQLHCNVTEDCPSSFCAFGCCQTGIP